MSNIVFVKSFDSVVEAELAKNLLETQEIITIVKKRTIDFPGGYFGDNTGADVYVSETKLQKAKEILGVEDGC